MEWMFMLPQNSGIEVLTSNATVFGDRAFTEVIKVKREHGVGPQSDRISVLIKRELKRWTPLSLSLSAYLSLSLSPLPHTCTKEEFIWGHSEKAAVTGNQETHPPW